MADSPLNNSWPSFSKLWMKRWSFKRASECKPCSRPSEAPSSQRGSQSQPPSGKGSSSSLSPASITEDVFFGGTNDDQDACSVVSDYDCPFVEVGSSIEDLQGFSSSLRDSEFYRDLHPSTGSTTVPEGRTQPVPLNTDVFTPLTSHPPPSSAAPPFPSCTLPAEEPAGSFVVTQLSPKLLPACIIDSDPVGPVAGLSLTIDLNGLLGSMETEEPVTGLERVNERLSMDLDGEPDLDSFPILVRSMSTSRRHSWGVPVSPINLGRRLSLDPMAMDSDGERDDDDEERQNRLFQSTQQSDGCSVCPGDELDGSSLRAGAAPGRHLYSRSDILATDDYSRAAHISRVVQTSKQAARAAGADEFDPEENLHSTEGQSHIAKQRNNRSDTRDSGSVTWYEFLANENEEEEDRAEKVEKGTKVKRTLSSLRNRMTGSFNKDKGKNREKAKEKEAKEKEKVCSSSSVSGHHLVPGSFSSCATCSLCSKTLQKKHGLQCMNCAVNVHKSCKSLLGECTSSKNKRDSLQRPGSSGSPNLALRDRDRERDQAGPAASQALDGHRGFLSPPGMTVSSWGSSTQPTAAQTSSSSAAPASSLGHSLHHNSSSGSLPGEMDETDALRSKRCNEDAISLAPSTAESIIVEGELTDGGTVFLP
ncbi:uncharacterized protein LOC103374776 isoform X2 [Stegastes partitus]|uniref:Uncharacterized protein LOC103374776 isoform X2 n=1 Tax=Stegastes partitus TaxID=144197 RepID=A0A9Y4NTA1_9TELE|nr:PREDICTED: uncharacterized protein LOC103374776 isoform X2 [Stegastes partitus]